MKSALAFTFFIITVEGLSVKLLYGESHGISCTDLSDNERLPSLLTRMYLNVNSLDYHYKQGWLFYTGWGSIWRMSISETASPSKDDAVEVVEQEAAVTSVAVDWERDFLYWVSQSTRSVWRANLTGGDRTVLIRNTGNLSQHSNLVIDPYARYLFIATDGVYSLRSDLDGNCVVRLRHGNFRVVSLALDTFARRLYVSGSQDYTPQILSSEYDGSGVLNHVVTEGAEWWVSFVSIDVFGTQLFWAHHGWHDRDTVWKANISETGSLTWEKEYTSRGTILDPLTKILSMKVYHPSVQRPPVNATLKFLQTKALIEVPENTCNEEHLEPKSASCCQHFTTGLILSALLVALAGVVAV